MYFQIRGLLGCNNILCYKFALLLSLVPSTTLSAILSAWSRKYLFPNGYKIVDQTKIEPTENFSKLDIRTLRVCVFSLFCTTTVIYGFTKIRPESNLAYKARTIKPRIKHKIRNFKFKNKKKSKKLHKENIC
jgi:hypothetical protein